MQKCIYKNCGFWSLFFAKKSTLLNMKISWFPHTHTHIYIYEREREREKEREGGGNWGKSQYGKLSWHVSLKDIYIGNEILFRKNEIVHHRNTHDSILNIKKRISLTTKVYRTSMKILQLIYDLIPYNIPSHLPLTKFILEEYGILEDISNRKWNKPIFIIKA